VKIVRLCRSRGLGKSGGEAKRRNVRTKKRSMKRGID